MKYKFLLIFVVIALVALSIFSSGCVQKNEADEHFDNAVKFMEMQMFTEAIIELKNGMRCAEKDKTLKDSSEIQVLKASVLMFDDRNEEASETLEQLIKEHKDYWNAYVLLGALYIQKKDYKKAVIVFKNIPVSEFNYGQADFAEGLVSFNNQNYGRAIEKFELARAVFNQESLRFKETSGSLQFIKSGANLMVSYLLGRSYEETGRLKDAFESYKQVEDINPKFPGIKQNISIVMQKIDLKNGPDNASLYNSIGWSYLEMGQLDKAMENFQEAIKKNPKLSAAYNNLGLAYYEARDFEKAKPCFDKAIELNNDTKASMYAYYNLGRILRRENDISGAISDLEESLKIYPSYEPAKTEIKIALLLQMIKAGSNQKGLYSDLGDSYFANNEFDNAIRAYKKAGDYAENYYKLARAYFIEGKTSDGIVVLNKLLEAEPENWEAAILLGKAFKTQGEFQQAIELFKKVEQSAPPDLANTAAEELAYMYFEDGNIASAKKEFEKLASMDSYKYRARVKDILGVIS